MRMRSLVSDVAPCHFEVRLLNLMDMEYKQRRSSQSLGGIAHGGRNHCF
jgi:hypothetical protein